LQIGPDGYPAEPIYLDFDVQFDLRGFPSPYERRKFYPEVQEAACQRFNHPAFTATTMDRLTTWLYTQFPTQDVYGIPLRTVVAQLRAGLEQRKPSNPLAPPTPSASRARRAEPGQPSRDRQSDIIAAIVAAGTPLTRPELVEAMRLTTEGRLGAQLAWMVRNNLLVNIPTRGYWPANRPAPD
jgi:hypothetical protein